MLHKWAPRSYVAKAACEALWSSGSFNHGWYFDSETIIDPQAELCLMTSERDRKPIGRPIDLRECVQELGLYTNPNPWNLADPKDYDRESLLKLKRELSQLHEFPHLRRLQLEIWIPQDCDAYFEGMIVVESINDACKGLKQRIGAGLNVMLLRAWPYDIGNFEFMETYDITWMWDKPTQAEMNRVRDGLATPDEKIRVLIANGVNLNGEIFDGVNPLLEELRDAGSFLPQTKEDIVKMEVWQPWTGLDMARWEWTREY